jgi:membrane-associated phospholipid phosphatase
MEGMATPWLTDVMRICYLSYHIYLFMVFAHAVLAPHEFGHHLSPCLFTGFSIGFAGYLLVPAIGPADAFPELFNKPLGGSFITQLISRLIDAGSSRFDTFPSLHILITCILLEYDRRFVPWRFWLMLVPAIGLMISTIYLRYHYGVDVIAGLLLFFVLRKVFSNNAERIGRPHELKPQLN